MNEPKVYIDCSCGTETICVHYDEEIKMFDMAFFAYGHGRVSDWRYRLRTIWRVLTKGTPYADSVCLTKEETAKMVGFLQEHLTEPEKAK